MNQWRNTQEVISWFKGIKNKEKSSFIKFDIVDFYPSISKELLTNAIKVAGTITTIDKKVVDTIMHSRKSSLFNNHEIWVKKENPNFDVTVGSFDGAEVCELVGLYLLNILKNEFGGKNIGLYREDGLSCFENKSGPELEKIKKKICKIFKDNGLNITNETNLLITVYLDVTFNLKTGKYYPHRKQNNSLQYIHNKYNHPPSVIKRILSMIGKRLSDISSNKEHFDKAAPIYNEALKNSGFNETLKLLPTIPTRSYRERNIIWFKPPFSGNVKTNVGKLFLNILQKHFESTYHLAVMLKQM